jgi:chromate transporter
MAEMQGRENVTLGELARYFVTLGAVGFGGPIALAGRMQRDLVDDRKWFTREEYLDGLALAQLSPGPLAAQLAMYLGWVRAGAWGAAVTGITFVAPSLVMVLLLAALYVRFGGLGWIEGAFYGVGAAVIALIARGAIKLAQTTLGRDRLLWALSLASALVTVITESEIVALFLGSGLLVMFVRAPPRWKGSSALAVLPPFLVTGAHGAASNSALRQIAWFFTKAGAFVFGSGLAIVPFLYGGVVKDFGWLNEQQFRDAVAVAMITPGPVVITAGFIGYLAGGVVGALLAAAGTFGPPFLVVVLAARHLRKPSPPLRAFVTGVTAAAAGAIGGASIVLGRRAIVDIPTLLLAVGTFAALLRWKRVPEPAWIALAAAIGLAVHAMRGVS